MSAAKEFDCVVCGSCVVDVLVHPLPVKAGLEAGRLYEVGPLTLETGGIVSNTGAALARMGLSVAGFSYVGDDSFGEFITSRYQELGIDTAGIVVHPSEPTSSSAVLIDSGGERTFAHCVGAPQTMDGEWFEKHIDLFARSRSAIIGYFSLMPRLEADLPSVLKRLQEVGCLTVLEAAGDGGTLDRLAPSLPLLDIYFPSYDEASHQTGKTEVSEILAEYRKLGARGTLGIKLGELGAVVSPEGEEVIAIPPVQPPGEVVDTTGAGDAFLAGFVAGTLRGLAPLEAGRLAAAAGASCICGMGANSALGDFQQLKELCGL